MYETWMREWQNIRNNIQPAATNAAGQGKKSERTFQPTPVLYKQVEVPCPFSSTNEHVEIELLSAKLAHMCGPTWKSIPVLQNSHMCGMHVADTVEWYKQNI